MGKELYEICFDKQGRILPEFCGELNAEWYYERILFGTWSASHCHVLVLVKACSLHDACSIGREIILPFFKAGISRGNYPLKRL